MKLTKQLKSAIITHAKAVYPSECCGLVINGTYHPCNNIAPNPVDTFEIDPVQFIELSALGDIQAMSTLTQTAMLSLPKWTKFKWAYMGWIG